MPHIAYPTNDISYYILYCASQSRLSTLVAGFQSHSHIAHCNHPRDYTTGTGEARVTYVIRICVRLHRSK